MNVVFRSGDSVKVTNPLRDLCGTVGIIRKVSRALIGSGKLCAVKFENGDLVQFQDKELEHCNGEEEPSPPPLVQTAPKPQDENLTQAKFMAFYREVNLPRPVRDGAPDSVSPEVIGVCRKCHQQGRMLYGIGRCERADLSGRRCGGALHVPVPNPRPWNDYSQIEPPDGRDVELKMNDGTIINAQAFWDDSDACYYVPDIPELFTTHWRELEVS